ncbi:MAG TPA: multicopper oxidase domain-containing protein, partial [Pirellulaceae bacterium]|nr:multicopper oxidase domain-containing protein [Pirellulaceae bacterium]
MQVHLGCGAGSALRARRLTRSATAVSLVYLAGLWASTCDFSSSPSVASAQEQPAGSRPAAARRATPTEQASADGGATEQPGVEPSKPDELIRAIHELYRAHDRDVRRREAEKAAARSESKRGAKTTRPPARNPGELQTDFNPKSSLRPIELRSARGRLDVTFDVRYHTFKIGNDEVKLRTYNGTLIGPVLRLKAGDTLYATLINHLPPEPLPVHPGNGHHAWNTTNLHFHGLHVAPQGPPGKPEEESDNVLLELPPSKPFDPQVSVQKYAV